MDLFRNRRNDSLNYVSDIQYIVLSLRFVTLYPSSRLCYEIWLNMTRTQDFVFNSQCSVLDWLQFMHRFIITWVIVQAYSDLICDL